MHELVNVSHEIEPKETVFYVASTSAHKLGAVEHALKILIPNAHFRVEGIKSASEVNEQPCGHAEILQGALNRLKNMKIKLLEQGLTSKNDQYFFVGIENGVYQVGQTWFDIGYVILENSQGIRAIVPSAGIEFPEEYTEEARRRGFETTTIGSVMAEVLNDPALCTNPHKYLTGGKITRSQLIEEAFVLAKNQLDFYELQQQI